MPRAVQAGVGALLVAIVVLLGNSVLAWRGEWADAGAVARAGAVGPTLLLAGALLFLLALAAGRRSVLALAGLVLLAGSAVVMTSYRAIVGMLPEGAVAIVALADAALALLGVALLLVGRGARTWFREKDGQ